MERCPPWRLRRRRLEGSVEDERLGFSIEPVAEAVPFVVTGGLGAVTGEGWRAVVVEDWTSRVRELLAIVVEGPALPARGCNGVEAPVVEPERDGRR